MFLPNKLICDFIASLARQTATTWVLDKSEYFVFSCIGLNNEHPLSFVDVIEGAVDVETNEFFILKYFNCSKSYGVHYCIPYWHFD